MRLVTVSELRFLHRPNRPRKRTRPRNRHDQRHLVSLMLRRSKRRVPRHLVPNRYRRRLGRRGLIYGNNQPLRLSNRHRLRPLMRGPERRPKQY